MPPSQMHEHPLLLVPRESRRELLRKLFRQEGLSERHVIPHKILEGELDFNSKQIYDFLMRKYKGDWMRVMDHVLVQRIIYTESGGIGIAKIPPEGNVGPDSTPVTIDENFQYIAIRTNQVRLTRLLGRSVRANQSVVLVTALV